MPLLSQDPWYGAVLQERQLGVSCLSGEGLSQGPDSVLVKFPQPSCRGRPVLVCEASILLSLYPPLALTQYVVPFLSVISLVRPSSRDLL